MCHVYVSSFGSFSFVVFFFHSHKDARKSGWQASAANISECDLALIPLLYPLDLNNGDHANSSSVTVNLQTHSTEFNRAAGNLLRKFRKNVLLENPLSFYLNLIYTRNEKEHLPIYRWCIWITNAIKLQWYYFEIVNIFCEIWLNSFGIFLNFIVSYL